MSTIALAVLLRVATTSIAKTAMARVRKHRAISCGRSWLGIQEPFYFVADACYATGNIVRGLLGHGNHLVTRVKSNSAAFFPAAVPSPNMPRPKGRPAKYGKKIKVAALLKQTAQLQEAPSPSMARRA